MTLEQVAGMLGADGANGVVDELRQYEKLVGHWSGHDSNNDVEQTLFACALDLRDRLPRYEKMYKLLGEEPPLCIEDTLQALESLIPFLAQWDCVVLRRRSRKASIYAPMAATPFGGPPLADRLRIGRSVSGLIGC
jgi:hypothetical protein